MNTIYLSPYLHFNGNCREAMEFYKSILGGELQMSTAGDTPMQVPESEKNRVIHATLKNDFTNFMASDSVAGQDVIFGSNIEMSLAGTDEKRMRDFFTALSKEGTITMPFDKQFWGDIFGSLIDKFGVHWMINISPSDQAAAKE